MRLTRSLTTAGRRRQQQHQNMNYLLKDVLMVGDAHDGHPGQRELERPEDHGRDEGERDGRED
eukprot:2601308-Heterocapsa_arctica.AAC.1